jgi:3-hydroxypropanoate dehydrogenase
MGQGAWRNAVGYSAALHQPLHWTIAIMPLDAAALDRIFRNARTANGFLDRPVPDNLLRQVYELAAWGPTSMNTQPARYVFVRTAQGKAKLKDCLMPGNVDKTMLAPVTVIVAVDSQFHEHMPQVWHVAGARDLFAGNPALAQATARRNATLGGAYLMIAARALGLDCGPMSGFDAGKVNAAFFSDGRYAVDFLVNLGYGDDSKLFARNPRLSFEQACTLA